MTADDPSAAPAVTEPDGSRAVLEISDLVRRFGEATVIDGLSLRLSPGDRVALHGPNGSGKTTVLRCISGALTVNAGRIRIAGHEAGTIAGRRALGASFSQERSFYLRLTGRQNLLVFARLRRRTREAASEIDDLVEELDLGDVAAIRVDRCSTGMVQQLSFARALIGAPRLLLLDEPTRSLDERAHDMFWSALDRRPEVAVLLATHRPEDLDRCDRVVELG